VYHTHKSVKGGHARELAIDRLTVDVTPDGTLRVRIAGPTRDPQPLPSGAAAVSQGPRVESPSAASP
jgi:hypothetical protein